MSRRLVLLRHGQTDWNASRRMQGQRNSQLDETGLAQAVAVAPVIAGYRPEVIWTSDLDRAARTAQIVGESCGCAPVYDARLREYTLGAWEGKTHDEFLAQAPALFESFRADRWDEISEIESPSAVAQRFTGCLDDVVAGLGSDATGVVVAHGAAIRTGLVAWLGWIPELARTLAPLGNCAWVELVESDTGWLLGAYNRAVS